MNGNAIDFEIEGGQELSGEVTTKTSKNAAVFLLAASLLNEGSTRYKNIAKIEEVNRLIEVLRSVGISIDWDGNDLVIKKPNKLTLDSINKESAEKTRSILLFIGPLIHLFDNFSLPQAGGCKLGSRTIKPHLFALERLGIEIETKSDSYEIRSENLEANEIILYESSDTATGNALMAAAKIPGTTTIKYASANYQVQDLCFFLEKLGIKIEGIGTTTLIIEGVESIDKDVVYEPAEDPIDAMLFISLAATTNSEIMIKRAPINFLELELLKLSKMGFKYKLSNPYLADNGKTNLVDIQTKKSKLKSLDEDKIESRPYPGLNIDNLPFFVPIATQAEGQTLIHDWVYENRAIYYTELQKMGADMILADPHRLFINGPTELRPVEMSCPPALRPAAIILIAMLKAEGKSTLRNVYSILRGYEDLADRLSKLGAKIKVLKS